MFAQDSIDLLRNSGIQFDKHDDEGIDPYDFAELLITSGIVLNENVEWISFHSGYDFGYLLKILTGQNLLSEESEFFDLLKIYFPCTYDVKYLMKSCNNLKGGLQEVGRQDDAGQIVCLFNTYFKNSSSRIRFRLLINYNWSVKDLNIRPEVIVF